MTGTPVICSAACGARAVVQASGAGGVFPTNESPALRQLLAKALAKGKIGNADRARLRSWATCLDAAAGAAYLEAILELDQVSMAQSPSPPWHGG
jgi:glycosyltransferase involved in cell wall biosynthesis